MTITGPSLLVTADTDTLAGGGAALLPPYSPTPVAAVEFAIPRSETAAGALNVTCRQQPGGGGSGRGCGIAEVWLMLQE